MAQRKKRITIEVNREAHDAVKKVLEERGTTIESYLELQLMSFRYGVMVYDLDSPLGFGRYRGCQLEQVIRCDPSYIVWACRTIERFSLTPNALRLLRQVYGAAPDEPEAQETDEHGELIY